MDRLSNAVPVGEGLLTTPLSPAENVRINGSRCSECGEVMLGSYKSCANCGGESMQQIPLGKRGKVWTYTVIRHQPPGQYRGPKDPFVPFAEGLVELPEGIRVVSALDCDLEKVHIGMEVELVVYELYQNEQGQPVMAFKFKAV
ncbi:MAG: OB-fold domain-containing protein [Synergistaceae bacterium]|jgi:uncharacterized OB-fold protein|nr:OB-fold domain-containing protein [Synergistaceae bacterium]